MFIGTGMSVVQQAKQTSGSFTPPGAVGNVQQNTGNTVVQTDTVSGNAQVKTS